MLRAGRRAVPLRVQELSVRTLTHDVDLCLVGGGMAGLCAAVAAARHGARVALVHDRPVLGGNASSEVRMHIGGAHGPHHRETGLLEEIELTNIARNPSASYAIWDSILWECARREPGLTLILNASVNQAAMDGDRLASVTAWQLTSETWHVVRAPLFGDCSGDSILAPLTGAEVRIGREARGEFGEDIEPEQPDARTMGMSCLIQARETDRPVPFVPPPWAKVYASDADLPHRDHDHRRTNFWWLELGGEQDTVHDAEALRDELLAAAFGVWDHIKNRGDHGAANWALDWVGFLPGKRESRRYVGDHMLTQNDVRAEGRFDDLVAYGGWSMDDHHPGGLAWPGQPTIFHPAPSPFGIPYRCLYSRNIANLFCAGRNISATHAALSSSRVMATCAVLGQAMGTAAAIAAREGCGPRAVHEHHLRELQQTLLDDDCWLPWQTRQVPALSRAAVLTASEGDPEPLRNGLDRPDGEVDHGWRGAPGSWIQYSFATPTAVSQVRLVFDSDLNRRGKNMPCAWPRDPTTIASPGACQLHHPAPPTLVRAFRVESLAADGAWAEVARVEDNHQRLVRVPLAVDTSALRVVLTATWGAPDCHLFACDVR
jgi:hypothetical protein